MPSRFRLRSRAPASQGGGSTVAMQFNVGWENSPSTGCGGAFPSLTITDNLTFTNDYGPPDVCSGPITEVVNDFAAAGNNSLRVNMLAGYGSNGPDFRIGPMSSVFGSTNKTYVFVRWYQRFSTNYFFAQHDHKMIIAGTSDNPQMLYIQLEGDAGNATASLKVQVYGTDANGGNVPSDGIVWKSNNITITRGVFHRFECMMRFDNTTNSLIYRMDGVDGVFTTGNPLAFRNIQLGNIGISHIKWDTTYNGYDEAEVQAATPFYTWVDNFALGTSTWIGTA